MGLMESMIRLERQTLSKKKKKKKLLIREILERKPNRYNGKRTKVRVQDDLSKEG